MTINSLERSPRRSRRLLVAAAVVTLVTACEHGTLDVQLDSEAGGNPATSTDDGSGGYPVISGDGSSETPETDDDGVVIIDEPDEAEAPAPILQNATVGERCIDGESVRYLILSDTPSDCATDAERIDTAATSGELVGAVAVELPETPPTQQTVTYCPEPGNCQDVVLDFAIEDQGAVVSGSWTGAPDGEDRTIDFTATSCAFDDVVDPLPADTPAAGISIDAVAVYQGVKIPIVEDGALIADRNAPVVAGRPGVVRVFVEPQVDWEPRDVVVRLTVGDTVKEQTFQPSGGSTEMNENSTVNFDLAAGELVGDADYSVEILEAQACADVGGELATPRVPEADVTPLQSTALAKKMEIVLVPIQYDADGSGRTPDLGQATLDRFKAEAFKNYPVHEVDVTVREAVATGQGLSPNGTGFGQMLNLCLNVRANDNPAPDVYYYCVIQPANTSQEFCGGGCVAGVAPVPGANDVGARGGIGISFNGDGEGVFVHEVGHALGRPHSPCGGASGTDPNYPYAQGLIGSWGYDIMNGQLFEPTQRADFMGYCNPTWVSDYTYSRIFDRLETVLGTQSFMVSTPPTTWRTAVVENGEASWGDDVTLKHLPTGQPIGAELLDVDGSSMGSPEVYATPVADIDAVLLTIEDTGFSGGTIDIPGLGEIVVQ